MISRIRLDLDATFRLLDAVGNPHEHLRCVLIGGTNGKGSVATFLARMSSAAGRRTGLFTSPHLVREEEQIRVDDESISAEDLARRFELLRAAVPGLDPTPFELLTVAALCYFAEREVDLVVLEVGMGGARDCTNVARPLLSVVTNIGRDHQNFLGTDPIRIAREKAGILRPERPALFGWTSPETLAVLEETACEIGATPVVAPRIVAFEAFEETADEVRTGEERIVSLQTPRRSYRLRISVAGAWQAQNLALAVLAAEELAFPLEAIVNGAAACRRPGRMESVRLAGMRPILLDAAHNVDAVRALVHELDELGKPFDLLFGALADKEINEMLRLLMPRARRSIWTRPSDRTRAWDPLSFRDAFPSREIRIIDAPAEALEASLADPSPTLLVCGSLRLVGDIRALLAERSDDMPPMW